MFIRHSLLAKHQARVEYQQAVDAGRSASLLEQRAGDVLRLKLGLLPAGARAQVLVDMVFICDEQPPDGVLRLALPVAIGQVSRLKGITLRTVVLGDIFNHIRPNVLTRNFKFSSLNYAFHKS